MVCSVHRPQEIQVHIESGRRYVLQRLAKRDLARGARQFHAKKPHREMFVWTSEIPSFGGLCPTHVMSPV